MRDRCFFDIVIKKTDLDKFFEVFKRYKDEIDVVSPYDDAISYPPKEGELVRCIIAEWDGDEGYLWKLGDLNIPFYGEHSCGMEYPGAEFVFDESQPYNTLYLETSELEPNSFCIRFNSDGEPIQWTIEEVRRFYKLKNKIMDKGDLIYARDN